MGEHKYGIQSKLSIMCPQMKGKEQSSTDTIVAGHGRAGASTHLLTISDGEMHESFYSV
jgi:hypothetical protein